MDPVGPLDGGLAHINRYAYGYNNPYRYADPSGLEPGPEDGQHYDDFMEAEGKTAFSSEKSDAYWDLYDPPMPNLVDQIFAEVTALGTVQDVLDAFRGDIGWGMVLAGIVPGGKLVAKGAGKTGRGKNHLAPDTKAQGPHSTLRRDANGNVSHHAEWETNTKNPTGFDQTKRVDTQYSNPHTHVNKSTGNTVPTPHAHERGTPGGVRPARPDELPR